MSSNNHGSQWVWVKYILLASLMVVFVGLIRLTWWSFLETRDWFLFLDSPEAPYVALAMSVIFQFGQGPVLFVRGLMKTRQLDVENRIRRAQGNALELSILKEEHNKAWWGFWALTAAFLLFGGIDAFTNVEQMHGTLRLKQASGMIIGPEKFILVSLVGIVAVFFEEMLGVVFSLGSHTFNDIRVIHGYNRIAAIDVFADHARNILSGGGGQQSHQGGGDRSNRPVSAGAGFQARSGGGQNTSRNNSAFHTPEMRSPAGSSEGERPLF